MDAPELSTPPERSDPNEAARLRAGDSILFIDRKDREYLRTLKPGGRVHLRNGTMQADQLIGMLEGSLVHNTAGEPYLMLRPSFAHLVPNLPRRAQVIYPKDIGPILLWGDVYPGATVIEVGCGPGALTMALLRAVGGGGRVISYEAREEFVRMAQENIQRFHGAAPNWTVHLADAFDGFTETGVDRILLDIAEPWRLLEVVARSLRPGGILVGYLPTVLQVKQLVDRLRQHGGFARVEAMETWVRFWHVKELSIRPEHRMVGHTGFIVFAHRIVDAAEADAADPAADAPS